MCVKIKQIPMSASSATKKTEILTDDVLAQLDEAIHKAPCIGLAVDESTDVSDNAQLLVFVRFFNKDKEEFCEDLLGVTPLQTSTRGEDIYLPIKEMLKKRAIELKQVVSITTDGAPAMVGRERGAVARMKDDNPQLISYHCIIHQSVLCSTLSDEYAVVMNTMMRMINFLRASSSHQHRMLREFLREVDANADDLLLHNNVRWLSKGRVLERFWSIRGEIAAFLAQLKNQKATTFSLFLEDDKKMDIVAFLRKLVLFKEDLMADCAHFPTVKEQVQCERDVSSFVDFLDKLIVNFSMRFDSFSLGQQLTLFIQNPFLITDVREFSKEVTLLFKWENAGPLQIQLIDLQDGKTDPTTFWIQMVPETAFPGLRKLALYILTMFGSTYNCEAAFSTMNIIKSK
ncbi:protein ZBED8-like [Carassius auratus]|uniref:Protein ZBED8-like n=1 Tax=Carassius auratus TaxID=7957 RepID=A0A6P6K9C1_CARAU|nr:protein ZBED8-like [Carassius auratus]